MEIYRHPRNVVSLAFQSPCVDDSGNPEVKYDVPMQQCERQNQLREAALAVLQCIDRLNEEQREAMRNANYDRLMVIDRQMERYFGEKERAFGALLNHCREHGCAFSALLRSTP